MPLPLSLAQLAQQYEQAGLNMYGQEPDVSGLQQYARQRTQEGNSAALNAMAAQFAGQGFEPMQAQFLKQAAAAQEPLKVGNAGYITPKGEFVKDPTYQNDRRAEVLLRQAQSYRDLDYRNLNAEENRQMRLAMLNARTAASQDPNNPVNQQRIWRGEDTLRQSFDSQTKELRESMDATSKIGVIIAPFANQPLTNMPAVQQQSLIILLNKFLDPGSVVREGEFNRVVQAQGLIGRAQNLLNYIAAGKPLSAQSIKEIDGLAQLYNKAAKAKFSNISAQYTDIARRRGYDPNNVIITPGGALPNDADPLGILGGH